MNIRFLLPTLLLLAAAWSTPAGAQVSVTSFVDLGKLPSGIDSSARAINNSGEITGTSYISGPGNVAFRYDGDMTSLGTYGGLYGYTIATAINDSGVVAGRANVGTGLNYVAVVHSGGGFSPLGTLGGTDSQAEGINNAGVVVGISYTTGNTANRAFSYSGGSMTDLGTLGGTDSRAFGINSAGKIVGGSNNTGNSTYHVFLHAGGIMTGLGTLGGNYGEAYAINDSDQIVGESRNGSGQIHAFLYSGGVMTDLGTFGGTTSAAFGIDSYGNVVGTARNGSSQQRAFIYSDGTLYDLNTLASGFLGGAGFTDLRYAYDINDSGWIVGYGLHTDGEYRGYALQVSGTAIPEPSTYAALIGLVVLGWAGWRRHRSSRT
jgi:probable HAF family extracellular repeat protein